ncbi:MAG: hypothetical protein PHE83_19130, partial [Opitutaceae bacterium]|nr:hypothetical protein [Opitutaceae bacterium]
VQHPAVTPSFVLLGYATHFLLQLSATARRNGLGEPVLLEAHQAQEEAEERRLAPCQRAR